MRIIYGVQGTGNGHITRARVMARELYAAGIDVTFLFSGRPRKELFDMDIFNHFECRYGLTFHADKGKVSYLKTVLESRPVNFVKEVCSLDFKGYDLVISDFEPVTAWAAKKQKKQVIGIGHQYAFDHDIPKAGADPLASLVMKLFAPVDIGIGLHWHHFDQPVLPPIIETQSPPERIQKNKIIVYLPFEEQSSILKLLIPFTDYEFHIYTGIHIESEDQHIIIKPLSRDGFQRDLHDCAGIISNAGFELASESLQLGKKILAKPLASQMEQVSNGRALQQLGYGHITNHLQTSVIEQWLDDDRAVRVAYPNVAQILVQWIEDGMQPVDKDRCGMAWDSVVVEKVSL